MDDAFLKKGIMLIVDGSDPELVRNILETEMAYIESRHNEIRGVWDYVASAAPAWGMIGTLIGLIVMLGDMSDPDQLGPSMAVAIITTFYGSVVANFIAIPIAAKMKIYSAEEMLLKEVLIEGMLSIQAGENPRIIEEKLKAFLSPALRGAAPADEGGGRSAEE
jgi:chemotaxis protein MotA